MIEIILRPKDFTASEQQIRNGESRYRQLNFTHGTKKTLPSCCGVIDDFESFLLWTGDSARETVGFNAGAFGYTDSQHFRWWSRQVTLWLQSHHFL